ncbi:MAG: A/G-specific adenine glycosylase [Propionibacteriaceae bacterium]|nr:A/G-specific adenine glycosylase [Propionibacteriaceae bacterium]
MNPLVNPVLNWYHMHARALPWRGESHPGAWGVLVSEIMLAQTPVSRVLPYWESWMTRWPHPRDLAEAQVSDVLVAWGTLGYPRRALRLKEAAVMICEQYAGEVPDDQALLRTLPGIGEYTAAAVAAFAFGRRTVVLDTNVRRVLARADAGEALPLPHLTSAERAVADSIVPIDPAQAALWNQAVMELGAIVCKARDWDCAACPIADLCEWRKADYPGDVYAGKRRTQGWEGTNRQVRGQIMAILREAEGEAVPIAALTTAQQSAAVRAINGLVADGLAVREGEALRLP